MTLIYADLHVHSHYSRATSKLMNVKSLSKYAKIKGINLLGTGDFTHPSYFNELKALLADKGNGVYDYDGMDFIFTTEISLIYSEGGKGRRVHNVILAPSLSKAGEITEWLKTKGRVDYDGRPIFGFSCPELVENMRSIDDKIEVIPAHIWTPWFSALGSKSGFDSIDDCFGDQARHVHAIETGLSSDPAMNWRVSSLDRFSLVSFSDSHSAWPWRLGREATVFDFSELSYDNVITALRTRNGLEKTIEFFPEQGKYHLDGHRKCNVCLEPEESKKLGKMCPVCKRPLTIGVQHRVEELADREAGFRPDGAKDFISLIPLSEIIQLINGYGAVSSKKGWSIHEKLINEFGSENKILMETGQAEIARVVDPRIAEAVIKVRDGRVNYQAGFDGEYGIPLFSGKPKKLSWDQGSKEASQKSIMDF